MQRGRAEYPPSFYIQLLSIYLPQRQLSIFIYISRAPTSLLLRIIDDILIS